MLVVNRTDEFTNRIKIPHFNVLELCSYGCLILISQMQLFKVKLMTCYLSTDTSTQKLQPPYPSYVWTFSPNYLATKIMQISICIGCCIFQVGKSEQAQIPYVFNSILYLPLFDLLQPVPALLQYERQNMQEFHMRSTPYSVGNFVSTIQFILSHL